MNVVVDSGNTAAKVAIFDHQSLMEKIVFTDEESLRKFFSDRAITNLIVSSVNIPAEKILRWANQAQKKFSLVPGLPLPITVMYKTPLTLGVDRMAAACGAWQLFPHQNTLVIDAGTCITYEFVDDQGRYYGGAIAPGLNMRFRAMNNFTARLPLVSPVASPPLTGDTTEACMQSGVVNGMVAEIEGIVSRYEEKFPGLRVVLCGGDTAFFENQLKASIFASPELVLVGLNSILSHNVHL